MNEYFQRSMKTSLFNHKKGWDIILLLIHVWLGYRMITASYSSVTGILGSEKERAFFHKWFGDELHFPFPVFMAFIAKGAELLGGTLVLLGLFARAGALLIAFTMAVATLVANLGENWNIDGGFTVSYFLFALIILAWGAGPYSGDHLIQVWKKQTG
jgi:putative oxidoreductase